MTWMLMVSCLLAVLYVGAAIWALRGLPESISAMVYVLPEGGARWLWTIWLWLVSLGTLIPVIDLLALRGCEIVGFATMCCLVFCGAMPIFMKEHKRAHDALGIAGGLLSQACVACLAGGWNGWLWLWLLWPLLMASTLIRPRGWLGRLLQGRGCTVAEILCYVTVIGSASLAIATMTACP